jgi:hypothetical protein
MNIVTITIAVSDGRGGHFQSQLERILFHFGFRRVNSVTYRHDKIDPWELGNCINNFWDVVHRFGGRTRLSTFFMHVDRRPDADCIRARS